VISGGRCAPVARQDLAHMVAAGVRSIQAFPAHQLSAPGDIGVFAETKKSQCEEFSRRSKSPRSWCGGTAPPPPVAPDRRTRVAGSGRYRLPGCPRFQVPQHGIEVDARGIHYRPLGNLRKCRGHGQQFPANRPDAGIGLAGIHQRLNEVGQATGRRGSAWSTQCPLESLMAWFCAAAKPMFSSL